MVDIRPEFTGISRSALLPLNSRAVFGDPFAHILYGHISDTTVTKNTEKIKNAPLIKRMLYIDFLTLEFMKLNPRAKILNLGCGFCTRFHRLDNGLIVWTDVDEVSLFGDVKKEVLPNNDRYNFVQKNISSDLSDMLGYDLVIAEGVLMYIDKGEIISLLNNLRCQIIVELANNNRPDKPDAFKWHYDLSRDEFLSNRLVEEVCYDRNLQKYILLLDPI